MALLPDALAQVADEVCVLGEALDEDRAGAVESGGGVGDLTVGVDETRCSGGGVGAGVAEQQLGEGLESCLAGDLRLGAALRLEREVDVLEARLGLRGEDLRAQGLVELALLLDGGEHGSAPLLELAEVAETLLERAQLGVVEAARHLLAVARHEGDGRAAVEQAHGRGHLSVADAELLCDATFDGRHLHLHAHGG